MIGDRKHAAASLALIKGRPGTLVPGRSFTFC